MRRGNHQAGRFEGGAGEIVLVGADHAEVVHVGALGHQPIHQRLEERRSGQPHVASHDHAFDTEQGHEGTADGVGHPLVQLVWVNPPDIVSLEDRGGYRHSPLAVT